IAPAQNGSPPACSVPPVELQLELPWAAAVGSRTRAFSAPLSNAPCVGLHGMLGFTSTTQENKKIGRIMTSITETVILTQPLHCSSGHRPEPTHS
uniref:Uncharacterized protein n=1 Tax=Coturnix japonica TaxID=93934 RepID=A0A8C2U714_COTJA